MGQDMTEQDLLLNLKAAGFEGDMLKHYLSCWKEGKTGDQLKLLSAKRASLLEKVHRQEKQIDCLDYLVYRVKTGRISENKGG